LAVTVLCSYPIGSPMSASALGYPTPYTWDHIPSERYQAEERTRFITKSTVDAYPLSPTLAMALRFDERTRDVFSEFCRIILNYENYTGGGERDRNVPKKSSRRGISRGPRKAGASAAKGFGKSRTSNSAVEDARRRHSSSPLGSTGSSNESLRTPEDLLNRSEEDDVDDTAAAFENEDLITCYCNRPYAGRPMVECDSCLTWIHITCTDLKRRDRVPEVWHCYKCVEKRDKAKGNIQKLTGSSKRKATKGRKRNASNGESSSSSSSSSDSAPGSSPPTSKFPRRS